MLWTPLVVFEGSSGVEHGWLSPSELFGMRTVDSVEPPGRFLPVDVAVF